MHEDAPQLNHGGDKGSLSTIAYVQKCRSYRCHLDVCVDTAALAWIPIYPFARLQYLLCFVCRGPLPFPYLPKSAEEHVCENLPYDQVHTDLHH
jgi:hypothetical protein